MGKKKKKGSSSSSSGGFVVVLVIFVTMVFLLTKDTKPIEYVESLTNFEAPVQTKTTGTATVEVQGNEATLEYVASYSISGPIIYLQNHYGTDYTDKLYPTDVGIAWGKVADNKEKINFKVTGQGFLDYTANDKKWVETLGGDQAVISSYSNNHLIPSTSEIEKQFTQLRDDQYVKIEGYLVNVTGTDKNGNSVSLNTSTNRTDTGNGGAEILYVTNLIWLEEQSY